MTSSTAAATRSASLSPAMCRSAVRSWRAARTSAKLATTARAASATHSSRVAAHASIRRSAVCGTLRCPVAGRLADGGRCFILPGLSRVTGAAGSPGLAPARPGPEESAPYGSP